MILISLFSLRALGQGKGAENVPAIQGTVGNSAIPVPMATFRPTKTTPRSYASSVTGPVTDHVVG